MFDEKSYKKRYYEENRDKIKAKNARYYRDNAEKIKADVKARADADPEAVRDRLLRKKYKITVEEYERMLVAQNGVCAICEKQPSKRRLHVDHCHKTGRVRGLLCSNCNTAIGKLNDDPALMLKAASYVS